MEVVMMHKLFPYALCINNEIFLMHPTDYLAHPLDCLAHYQISSAPQKKSGDVPPPNNLEGALEI
jgi:hypothetical protein